VSIFKKTCSFLTFSIVTSVFISGCSSTTTIRSKPDGAEIMLNGNSMGKTPYSHTDSKVLFSKLQVSLEMPGFERFDGFIVRDEVAPAPLIFGILCFLPLVLWAWEYPPSYTFTLRPKAKASSPLRPKAKTTSLPDFLDPQSENSIKVVKFNPPLRNPEIIMMSARF
jgi:PEGA domain